MFFKWRLDYRDRNKKYMIFRFRVYLRKSSFFENVINKIKIGNIKIYIVIVFIVNSLFFLNVVVRLVFLFVV